MTAQRVPEPPKGTGPSGRDLWRDVLGKFELEEHEQALLREAVRSVDQLDVLHAIVKRDGTIIDGPSGPRMHPAAVEARQLRIALARVIAALRLPADDDSTLQRPQRRVGVRGIYSVKKGS
ncbi:terminase [Mycobacterium sp. SMC-18]|uniref:terminase n=1 Tax=Mycobacterium sp. SMC-18 TaxID=3381629 RepID=UPI003876B9A7